MMIVNWNRFSLNFSNKYVYDFKWSQHIVNCTERNKNKENLFALEVFGYVNIRSDRSKEEKKSAACKGFFTARWRRFMIFIMANIRNVGWTEKKHTHTQHCQQFIHSFLPELEKTMAIKEQSLS